MEVFKFETLPIKNPTITHRSKAIGELVTDDDNLRRFIPLGVEFAAQQPDGGAMNTSISDGA